MRSHHRLAPLLAPFVLAMVVVAGAVRPATAEQPAPYDPFVIPAAKFHAEVKTIALAPLGVSADPKAFSPLRTEAEARFAAALANRGFRVIPAQEYRRIWAVLAGRLGGVYDPVTGAPIADKWKACWDLVAHELAREHDVDAIAHGSFSLGSLRWGGSGFSGEAMTLGEQITMHGKPVSAMGYEGVNGVEGSWFGVIVRDLAGAELFDLRTPIRWERVYAARSWDDRPGKETADPGRIHAAIDAIAAAMGPKTAANP